MISGKVETSEQLRAIYKQPSEWAQLKQLKELDAHCHRFLTLSPFAVIATSSSRGADATPRGGSSGFVQSLDNRTLLIPDWSGNNRLDSLTNILENPDIGLLFLIPGVDETLRVNGRAEIRTDAELLERFRISGRVPLTVLLVQIQEAYLHCAKAFLRSKLWSEESKIDRSTLPSLGEILKDQLRLTDEPESQSAMEKRYKEKLY